MITTSKYLKNVNTKEGKGTGWERKNGFWVVERHWDGDTEEKRVWQAEKAWCPSRGSGAFLHCQPPPLQCLPLFPIPKAPQDYRPWRAASSHLRGMVQGVWLPRKHSVSESPPKREATPQGTGPRPKHQAKPLQLSLVKAKPLPGWSTHVAPESIRATKASGQQALPFPPPPCETPAGTAQPVTSITLLGFLSGPAAARTEEGSPRAWDAPCPETASGSHREQELPTPGGMQISHPTAVISAASAGRSQPSSHSLSTALPVAMQARSWQR